ncbi:cytosol aminopeptidase [Hyalella azteca]|uniref:Cytosol aminopeptidase n=1 Tax=Hyalella azteca TaxID=294128 RepID=A0A979FIK3_HYAAZ|nr:cytosol aminopeptidase [Hyalella azteca]
MCDRRIGSTGEAIRTAVAAGYRSLSEVGVSSVIVDACGDAEAAAEGAVLASFLYQTFKTEKKDRPDIVPHTETDRDAWKRGVALAEAQNLARELMETPANHLTPTIFAQRAKDVLEPLGVSVTPHDATWAQERRMGAFLSVTRGSAEPPVFLELSYDGAEQGQQHLALVGKGVTFDAGGISLKPSKGMEAMRADMGGAACVVGALHAIATLKLPLNVKAYIPLCENLPSGTATKPGDVITAANGKTIQVDNTDAEGRLILADALHFACLDKPRALVDMATLTGAMSVALGGGAAGAFSSSDELWHAMQAAGMTTGDRVWRMPLWQVYSKQVTEHGMADVHNLGKYEREAGSCTAASFLQQFVTCEHWMHLDIAGVMENRDEVPYLSKGMSGRPTRTIVQFAHLIASGQTQL